MKKVKKTIKSIKDVWVLHSDDQKYRTIGLNGLEITMDKKTYDSFLSLCVERNILQSLWEHRNEGHHNIFQAWREEIDSIANQVKKMTKRMEEGATK